MLPLELPPKPQLSVIARQADILFDHFQQDRPAAWTRAEYVRLRLDKGGISLENARLVVAREYGFSTWAALEEHINSLPVSKLKVYRLSGFSPPAYYEDLARCLVEDFAEGKPVAGKRVAAFWPDLPAAGRPKLTLDDALNVIAGEYAFPDWPALRDHVSNLQEPRYISPELQTAFDAIEDADVTGLQHLIDQYPALVNATHKGTGLIEKLIEARLMDEDVIMALVTLLLDAGVLPEHPFIVAGCFNRVDILKPLIAAGVDLDTTLEWGLTALESALFHGRNEATDLLSSHGLRRDTLWVAAGSGKLDRVKAWFDESGGLKPGAGSHRPNFADVGHPPGPPRGDSTRELLEEAFIMACLNNRVSAAGFLLEQGVDINTSLFNGLTGLHFAAWFGKREMVSFLAEKGADLTLQDAVYRGTPEGFARHNGHASIAAYLNEQAR